MEQEEWAKGSKAQAPSYKINTLTKLYCAFESR